MGHVLSIVEAASARDHLRRFTLATMTDGELAAEVECWTRLQLRHLHDLEIGDDDDGDEAALRGGVDYCEMRLGELTKEAEKRLRMQRHPAYPRERFTEDLTPRFEAARYCDLVDLVETLTAQQAVKTGNGRHRVRCPFHAGGHERSASLVIYPPGKGWHCFGCGRGGDAVAFVQELNHCGAVEALLFVEQIADTYPEAWTGVPS